MTIHLATLTTLTKEKSWTIISLFYAPLEFHPKMKNWITKLHKCPFKQRYIAGSAKYSTKPLSKLLTCIISVFSGVRITQSLVLYVCFVDRCLSFLLVIALSVLLRYTDSDCLYGIFKLFFWDRQKEWASGGDWKVWG